MRYIEYDNGWMQNQDELRMREWLLNLGAEDFGDEGTLVIIDLRAGRSSTTYLRIQAMLYSYSTVYFHRIHQLRCTVDDAKDQ